MSPGGGAFDVKIADFGLSALVRIDEDGYDAEESGKRKRYRSLKDVSYLVVCAFMADVLMGRCGEQKNILLRKSLSRLMAHKQTFGRWAACCLRC